MQKKLEMPLKTLSFMQVNKLAETFLVLWQSFLFFFVALAGPSLASGVVLWTVVSR